MNSGAGSNPPARDSRAAAAPGDGGALPLWLPRARLVRGAMLVLALGGLGLVAAARWPGGPVLVLALVAILAALWLDGLWLRHNHHRVNGWGLSRGRKARRRPQ